jgi:hypothetical protein
MGYPRPIRLAETEYRQCITCGKMFLSCGPADVFCTTECTPEYGWDFNYKEADDYDRPSSDSRVAYQRPA